MKVTFLLCCQKAFFSHLHGNNLVGLLEAKFAIACPPPPQLGPFGVFNAQASPWVFNAQGSPHWASSNSLITVLKCSYPYWLPLLACTPIKLCISLSTCLYSLEGKQFSLWPQFSERSRKRCFQFVWLFSYCDNGRDQFPSFKLFTCWVGIL